VPFTTTDRQTRPGSHRPRAIAHVMSEYQYLPGETPVETMGLEPTTPCVQGRAVLGRQCPVTIVTRTNTAVGCRPRAPSATSLWHGCGTTERLAPYRSVGAGSSSLLFSKRRARPGLGVPPTDHKPASLETRRRQTPLTSASACVGGPCCLRRQSRCPRPSSLLPRHMYRCRGRRLGPGAY
jgi:hypothetical protein